MTSREETLREAACAGDELTVRSLIQAGTDVNAQHAINKWTALHWATQRNHIGLIRLLLGNGAKVELEDSKGRTAPMLAKTDDARAVFSSMTGLSESTFTASSDMANNGLSFLPNYMQNPTFPYTQKYEETQTPPLVDASPGFANTYTNTTTHDAKPTPPPNALGQTRIHDRFTEHTQQGAPYDIVACAAVLQRCQTLRLNGKMNDSISKHIGLKALAMDTNVKVLWEAFKDDDDAFVYWANTLYETVD